MDGQSDFLLTYAHPEVPMLLDAQTFEFRVLGAENIIPFPPRRGWRTAAQPDGKREKPFAYLDYEKHRSSGRCCAIS